MKRVAPTPAIVPMSVKVAMSHLKRSTALRTRRQSTPLSARSPSNGATPRCGSAGATCGGTSGAGKLLIAIRYVPEEFPVRVGSRSAVPHDRRTANDSKSDTAQGAASRPHARGSCRKSVHRGPGRGCRLVRLVVDAPGCDAAFVPESLENPARCEVATGWPEPCVRGDQPELE